jgi:flavodoxin
LLRILIAYYSKTGNTEAISNAIKEALESTCQVDMLKIEMVKKYGDRLSHLNPRIFLDTILNRKPRIRSVADMNPYDLICVGTPNWYGRTAPPINTFIEEMTSIEGKKAIGFVSSDWGKKSYADDLRERLEKRGLKVLKALSLTLREISETQLREIRETLTSVN